MKTVLKNVTKIILFFSILYLLYAQVDKLLGLKTQDGIMQARGMYDQPKDTVDVVFLGASFVHCGVNTASLWINQGIAAYDYSAAEQPIWVTYYYLKEFCKYQNPKLVVLDVNLLCSTREDYDYGWLYDNLAGVRLSANKIGMVLSGCEPDRIFEFFPNITISHNRYKELEDKDYSYFKSKKEDREDFKGYTPHFRIDNPDVPVFTSEQKIPLTAKSEKYLKEIVEYTKKNGIDLYFVSTPYAIWQERQEELNYFEDYAKKEGLLFCNYNKYYDEMGINFEQDMKDWEHLNYSGGCKYSEYLGVVLKDTFDIPDRRGLEEYSSWYMNLEDVWSMAEEYSQ